MSDYVWKNPHKTKEFNFAVNNLLCLVFGIRINNKVNKVTSFQQVFQINQDGLQCRELSTAVKKNFKIDIMENWRSVLPSLPNPFTGKMEVHFHNLVIEVVKFIPK